MSLSVDRGTAVKSPGDVVTVSCLNRGTDQVLKAMAEAQERGANYVTLMLLGGAVAAAGLYADSVH